MSEANGHPSSFVAHMDKKRIFYNVDYLASAGVFLTTFAVYLRTLCPSVYVGDSGELIAAAYTLGIPHPPGYPIYCLVGKLFSYIPVGSIAYRLNIMSAFFASATCAMLYLIIYSVIIDYASRSDSLGL